MSHILKDLAELISPTVPLTGVVKSISKDLVMVATPNGSMEVSASVVVSVGDSVRIVQGVITGRVSTNSTLPIYQV